MNLQDDKPKGIFMKTHVPRKYMPHVAPVYTKRYTWMRNRDGDLEQRQDFFRDIKI